jgi:hypothetical protein
MTRREMVGALVGFGLMLAACGGGASPNAPTSDGAQAASPTGASGPTVTPPSDVQAGSGWGTAAIAIGDTQTDFAIPEFGCGARGGEDYAHGDSVDGSGASFMVNFPLVLDDWDSRHADEILVTIAGHRWLASGPGTEDHSTFVGPRVDSLEISPVTDDARSFHATGSFFIVDSTETPYSADRTDQVAGTFDITCNPTS